MPVVNSVILPFLHDPSYINDCLLYITALAEFSFSSFLSSQTSICEGKSLCCLLADRISEPIGRHFSRPVDVSRDFQLDETVLPVNSHCIFLLFVCRMVSIFIRTQSKVFSIICSDSEVALLSSLFDIILRGITFPAIQSAGTMISCLPLLMKLNDTLELKRQ